MEPQAQPLSKLNVACVKSLLTQDDLRAIAIDVLGNPEEWYIVQIGSEHGDNPAFGESIRVIAARDEEDLCLQVIRDELFLNNFAEHCLYLSIRRNNNGSGSDDSDVEGSDVISEDDEEDPDDGFDGELGERCPSIATLLEYYYQKYKAMITTEDGLLGFRSISREFYGNVVRYRKFVGVTTNNKLLPTLNGDLPRYGKEVVCPQCDGCGKLKVSKDAWMQRMVLYGGGGIENLTYYTSDYSGAEKIRVYSQEDGHYQDYIEGTKPRLRFPPMNPPPAL